MTLQPPTALLDVIDLAAVDEAVARGEAELEPFRNALKSIQNAIDGRFHTGVDIDALVHARAAVIDHILQAAWRLHLPPDTPDIALIAVGGYGRGELQPYSDIDIMVLLRDNTLIIDLSPLERLVRFCWDIGLELGHSVRSLDQCQQEAAKDITIATNMMEARLITGPEDLFEAMRELTSPEHIWPSDDFFRAKWQEQIQRHHKYDDATSNLEPNVKEGPGGLRDIQTIGWVAKRHFNAQTLHDLVVHGFLTENEYQTLIDGQNLLWQVRYGLHILAKRREDRLLFDMQQTLAKQFGYRDTATELAVEQFMKAYYRAITELNRLNEMLLQLFQEAILYPNDDQPIAINRRFQTRKGFIEVKNEEVFRRYPFALLEIFLLMQQHPDIKGVSAATIRLIRDHCHLVDDSFRADLRNRSLFMEILRQPRGLTNALRRMNRYGILANYIPAFGKIVGLMQYDLFHIYTVDEHTLMVIRNARRLSIDSYAHELPFCSALLKSLPKRELLYLAALFHDIAKGRGGDHSELGANEAWEFCINHGLSHYDAQLVSWLVRNHLLMSTTAQRKDLSDPDVIARFASQVGNMIQLNYLYLLTVVDIRATNASLWNSWRSALLMELYNAAKRALRRGLNNPVDLAERCANTKHAARERLLQQGIDADAIESVWAQLSDDYFNRHSDEEIARQTGAITENTEQDMPLVLVQQRSKRSATEIFIHAPISDHLFVATAGALDQMGLTILDARIITSNAGYAFDTYIVLEENGDPIDSELRLNEIRLRLQEEIRHPQPMPKQICRRTARRLRYFKTKTLINFSQDPQNQRTVMEIYTGDRPGLLSKIGAALIGCGAYVQNAKIATIGERVEDVFFITDAQQQPILADETLNCIQKSIELALQERC